MKYKISLATFFNLTTAIMILVVTIFLVYHNRNDARERALEEAKAKAEIILDRNLAIHTYFAKQLKPSVFKLTDQYRSNDYFDTRWMSSTYAVREIDKYSQSSKLNGFYYKECAINARSPENEADIFEKAFLQELNNKPELNEKSLIRKFGDKEFLVYLKRGEAMDEACLRCHSVPSEAPAGLVEFYGPERSFGRNVGEVVSAISIKIPLSEAYAKADKHSLYTSMIMLLSLLFFLLVQSLTFNFFVYQPLQKLRGMARKISNGEEEVGVKIKIPFLKDLSELADAFNIMSCKLKLKTDNLENLVDERTAKLKEANTKYLSLFNEMLDGFALHEILCDTSGTPVDYRFLAVNPAFEEQTGLKAADIIGKTVLEVLPSTEKLWIETYGKVALTGEHISFVNYAHELNKHFAVTAYCPTKNQFACIFKDVTDARRIEYERELNESRLQSLLSLYEKKSLPEKDLLDYALEEAVRMTQSECGYLHFIDDDQTHISLNSWSRDTLKLCTAQKTPHYPLDRAGIWADCVRAGKTVIHNDYPNHPEKKGYPDGHFPIRRHMSVPIFDNDKITAIIGVGNKTEPYNDADTRQIQLYFASTWDAVKQKRFAEEKSKLEARLIQAQKLEAIGTLAGGIAHDFNNILGVIIGYASMAKEDAPAGTSYQKDLEKISTAADRAKNLVKQILAFSRQAQAVNMPLSIKPLIKEGLTMLRSSIPSTISITTDIDPNCGVILADPTQIHQILMNLCTNAYHAMEDTGGELSVSLKNTLIDTDDQAKLLQLELGEYVKLTVSDTGIGIGGDVIDKIFDPFFTTKEIGKGTGMGLSIIHGIMKGYKGAITVESRRGKGSTFHAYFPTIQKDAIPEILESQYLPKGNERILLIDDEELLAEMGKDVLERLGYHVTVRHSSIEALTTFQNTPDTFDLIITDQTMPEMTGSDLARRMLQLRWDIPIILCTGFSNQIDEDSAKALGIKEFALKPLSKEVIAKLVRKVLDASC
nr:DUF3365 domain-containing protein [Desulfobulbaceae bacterium]